MHTLRAALGAPHPPRRNTVNTIRGLVWAILFGLNIYLITAATIWLATGGWETL